MFKKFKSALLFFFCFLFIFPLAASSYMPQNISAQGVDFTSGRYVDSDESLQIHGALSLRLIRKFDDANIQIGGWGWQPTLAEQKDPRQKNKGLHLKFDQQKIDVVNEEENKVLGFIRWSFSDDNSQAEIITNEGTRFHLKFNENGLLEYLERNQTSWLKYQYIKHPVSGEPLISRKEDDNGGYLINEYYQSGENKIGEQSLTLEENDFRIGKIKQQIAPTGENGSPVILARYFYTENSTTYLDAFGNTTLITFDSNRQIISIEQPLRRERFFWDDKKTITSRIIENERGEIVFCETFRYDTHHHLIEKRTWGNLSGNVKTPLVVDKKGVPLNHGIENYGVAYIYDKENHRLLEEKEDEGQRILYTYDERGLMVCKRLFHHERPLLRTIYGYNEDALLTFFAFDDGAGENAEDLSNVTERHVTSITLTNENDQILGLPKMIQEGHLDLKSGNVVTTKTTINTYDSSGNVIQREVCDAEGSCRKVLEASFDKHNRIVYHKTDDNKEVLFSYTPGTITAVDLSTSTEIVSILDKMGRSSRKIITDRQGLSKMMQEDYDLMGRKTTSFDLAHNATHTSYDALGNIISMEQPAIEGSQGEKITPKTHYEYDALGNIISTTDPRGYKTTIRYSSYGKPIEISYPDGTKETFTYSLKGKLLSSTAKNGMTINYRHDLLGNIIETVYQSHDGEILETTSHSYSSMHHLKEIDPNGTSTHFNYSSAGRLQLIEKEDTAGSSKEQYTYDAAGNLFETHLWHGLSEEEKAIIRIERNHDQEWISSSIYEADGTLVRIKKPQEKNPQTQPKSEMSANAVDAFGQRVTEMTSVDSLGSTTLVTYNALMKPSTIQNLSPQGSKLISTTFRYDAAGNKTHEIKETENSLDEIKWQYGPGNRLEKISISNSDGAERTTYYSYNHYGQLEKIIKPDGNTLIHTYDGKGRLSHFYSSDTTISYLYHYDAKDQIIRVDDLNNATSTLRSYDALGNITEETLGNSISLKTHYDLRGRRTQVDLHDGSSIHYQYDAADLRSITRYDAKGIEQYIHRFTDFDLNGNSIREKMIGDLGEIETAYDDLGRIISIHTPYWSVDITANGFDEKGNIQILSVDDFRGTHTSTYKYDPFNQLIEEESENSHQYHYDALGNRLSKDGKSQQIGNHHQVSRIEKISYTYDGNGSLIKENQPKQSKSFAYDALGRLISVEEEEKCITTYQYDAFHRRLSKTQKRWNERTSAWNEPIIRRFVFDGDREIGAVDDQGNFIELRILGEKHGAEIGAAIALEIDGKTYAPIHDHRGSIRCIVNVATHEIAENYLYSAFGEETILSQQGEKVNPRSCISPWRYSSKRFDPETGWIYFGKRYYDPQKGIWITTDLMGSFDGSNPYLFLKNNPLIHNDLYGLFSITAFFSSIYHGVNQSINEVVNFRTTYLAPWFDQNPLGDMETATASFVKTCVGESLYWMSGNAKNPGFLGVFGHGEPNDKRRITFINGILSAQNDQMQHVKAISKSHNDSNVHFVYRGTYGWSHDVMQAIVVRLGYISDEAQQLSSLWKSMINEMGGIHGGGLIVHYGHSLGAADTLAAKYLLSKEEAKMIRVITFGSPVIRNDQDFESISHHVSVRDFVPLFDFPRLIKARIYEEQHVVFEGTWLGIPFIDHMLHDYWRHMGESIHNHFDEILSL